jgi:hypothetical protein
LKIKIPRIGYLRLFIWFFAEVFLDFLSTFKTPVMKKIHLLGFALVFFSFFASAGHQASLLAVPSQAVVVGNPLFPPDVNLVKGIDQDLNKRLSINHRKFSSVKKMGFRNRLALRIMNKKIRSQAKRTGDDLTEADRLAKTSLTIGIIALVLALIPFFFTWLAAIPLGIIAISKGSKARKMGSTKTTGKTLGIVALVILGLWIIFAAIYFVFVGETLLSALFGV